MKIRTAVASATAVALAAGVGVGVGFALDRGDEGHGPSSAPVPVRLANASLEVADDCDALLESYVDRGLDLVSPYGWGGGAIVMFDARASTTVAGQSTANARVPTTTRATSNESGTNVQEVGVDEPDVVKVAGDLLFRIQDNVLTTHDVAGDEPRQLSSLQLPDLHDGELLLSGDRLVVLGDLGRRHQPTGARILVVDVSRPGTPQVVEETDYSASISAARLHGDVVRVVLDNGLPDLDFRLPHGKFSEDSAERFNRRLVRETTLADWLPTVGDEPAVDCGDVAVPTMETTLGTTTVVTFEPAVVEPVTTAVATTSTASYFSPDRFYLAAGPASFGWWGTPTIDCFETCPGGDGSTELFAFALDGTDTTYVASGTVEGQVRDRWSMDHADGALRVALGATNETGNFSSVVTLRETGTTLTEIGRVDKLGVNEEIKSVRWFDTLAIVVTFRQTDPLYAIDLTDPDEPELMGELKIPGFSEYLHPLGERRLIGVGQDADSRGMTRGAQAALFDVTDLTDPRQLDVVAYPKHSMAGAGIDPRQFTWLPDRRTALTVVSQGWRGRTGWVSVLSLQAGEISNRMVEVEYGDEVAEVRLVPLADGRVVLVTGDAVSFFDLS
ncbi:beta-propeller domain-containing protein [Nocardioides sp. CF8]|uniref:beta-propeller domain-containing protein n=1 Tax=Nocardioides sp. CF8 TaxID=110319 RepID=UPI00056892EB|nr:beta-propeller domain-containing protein [Nocardioides sp. CF8]